MRVFDLHADTMMDIANHTVNGKSDILETYHFPKYRQGEIGGQIFALWTPNVMDAADEYFIDVPENSLDCFMMVLSRSLKAFRENKQIEIAYNGTDIERIYDSGKDPLLLGVEGFYGFNGEIGMIDVLYDLGFRHAMLTWNDDNEWASGAEFTDEDRGLTPLGIEAVKRMQELGMIVDVSHASFKGFWDIMENTTGPIIASHSNAWSLCPCARNLKDDQLRAIADRGGVIGMNSWMGFIREDMHNATVQDLAKHARYIADLIGPEFVACGFDFCDYFNMDDTLPGLRHAGESQNFVQALRDVGFSEKEVQAIAWDNAVRVIKSILG